MLREAAEPGGHAAGQDQFRTGKWIFLHDRCVVETFYEGVGASERFHVDHLRIHGRPSGSDLKIRWGIEVGGSIVNGGRETIPAHQVGAFNAFVDRILTYRTVAQA